MLINSAAVFDAVAIIQRHKPTGTFGNLSKGILRNIIKVAQTNRIDVVFDVYRIHSIKNAERSRREKDTSVRFTSFLPEHVVKQWAKFLKSSYNERTLIMFLLSEWKKEKHGSKLGGKELFLAFDEQCLKLTRDGCEEIDHLNSSQEEVDTRMLLHAKDIASQGFTSIVIHTPDTDVPIITLGVSMQIHANIYLKNGVKNNVRIISLSLLRQQLKIYLPASSNRAVSDICEALVSLHALTGCDSVSAFPRKGKIGPFKAVYLYDSYIDSFQQLGSSWTLKRRSSAKNGEICMPHVRLQATKFGK